ncbi:uncharacterized protein, partial [Amphiura filiformis]|uniref:uncharacterized protein n=1 Tax=Amphiura filiformis TaxID=82378 RepID=UPI003B2131BE
MFGPTLILLGILTLCLQDVYGQGPVYPVYMCVDSSGAETEPVGFIKGTNPGVCTFPESAGYGIIAIKVFQDSGTDDAYTSQFVSTYVSAAPTDPGVTAATEGADYGPIIEWIPIPKNAVGGPFTRSLIYIPIIDDTEIEPTEEFILDAEFVETAKRELVTDCDSATLPCGVFIQIMDDDEPCVSFDKSHYFVTEGVDTSIGFVIPNDPAMLMTPVSVAFTTTDGSAIAGTDYTVDASPVDVTAPAGMISVTATCDLVEGVEAFEISIDVGTYKLGTPSTATVWISDGDCPVVTTPSPTAAATTASPVVTPVPCVSFLKSSYFVTEGGDPTSIELVLSNVDSSVVAPVSVAFTVTPVSAIATDYTVDSSPVDVTVPTGEISVAAMDDALVEGVEAFQICIDPPTTPTAYKLGTTSDVTVWILDAAVVTTTPATTTTPAL